MTKNKKDVKTEINGYDYETFENIKRGNIYGIFPEDEEEKEEEEIIVNRHLNHMIKDYIIRFCECWDSKNGLEEIIIDKIDLDGTVFTVTEPVDTDILIDIADDGLDSQHYAADSIDDEHINWADITNLSAGGVLDSLGGDVAVGAHEFQSTGNIVLQLGDAAGSNVFEIEDSGGVEVFQVDSDGVINSTGTPSLKLLDDDTKTNALVINGNVDANNDATIDFDVLINNEEVEMLSLDGAANSGAGGVIISHPVTAPAADTGT